MARYVVGDPVVLTVTFTVSGTNTDPDTVTLLVTDPSGTETTYTYAGATVTKTSTGVYTKTITTDTAGTWTYKWTGTGAAPDVEDGTFDVWPVFDPAATAVLSLGEAKQALNLSRDNSDHDDELLLWISAVSQRLDELCGAVVIRTVTDEVHDGGKPFVSLHKAPVSQTSATTITSVSEYDHTTLTALTAETNAAKPASSYFFNRPLGLLYRRSSGSAARFASGSGNILVTYEAGRYADTGAVDGRFKLTASMILRRLWAKEQGAWARGGDPFEPAGAGTVGFFKAMSDTMIREFLSDELRGPVVA